MKLLNLNNTNYFSYAAYLGGICEEEYKRWSYSFVR